jgi:hypothetical protein
MQAAREASWLPSSSAANQRCRSGLSACHEGCRVLDERTQIARPQWTNTDTAASGTLRLRSEAGPLRPSEVETPLRILHGKSRQMRVFAS